MRILPDVIAPRVIDPWLVGYYLAVVIGVVITAALMWVAWDNRRRMRAVDRARRESRPHHESEE